jgi:hypothetical protein
MDLQNRVTPLRRVEKLRFHCGSRMTILPKMSALTKAERFNLVEDAVITGIAPAEIYG